MLRDPRVNFAISARDHESGISHLGIQVDTDAELAHVTDRLKAAETAVEPESDAHCCYARGNKSWTEDPQGVRWENFVTHGAIPVFGSDVSGAPEPGAVPAAALCCGRSCG